MGSTQPSQDPGALTRRSGSSFLMGFLFLDQPQRRALEAVYAFCRIVDDVVDKEGEGGLDKDAASAELSRYRRVVAGVFTGQVDTPLKKGLHFAVTRYGIRQEDLVAVIAGCEMDLEVRRYDTFVQLEEYCHKVASAVGRMCVAIFGVQGEEVFPYADATGLALQLTNILRDIGEDHARGRVYIPAEDLDRFHLSAADLDPQEPCQGESLHRLAGLLAFQIKRARHFYAESDRLFPVGFRRSLLPGEIMKEIYRSLLDQVERLGPKVLVRRAKVGRSKKLFLAVRTWWGALFSPR